MKSGNKAENLEGQTMNKVLIIYSHPGQALFFSITCNGCRVIYFCFKNGFHKFFLTTYYSSSIFSWDFSTTFLMKCSVLISDQSQSFEVAE